MRLSGSDIAAAVSGKCALTDWTAEGYSIDTRTLQRGDLFIALKGPNHDGHDYIKQAAEKGAVAALVEKEIKGSIPCIVVKDAEKALAQLGAYVRSQTKATIIAVTGSVGKTTVKSAIHACLKQVDPSAYATVGNLNNHLGLPLSLCRIPDDAKSAVYELGMNHAGEITVLTRQAKPEITLITTVEAVHIEFFQSVEGIARAKAEIFEGLVGKKVAILPYDNLYYPLLRELAEKAGAVSMLTFGKNKGADFQYLDSTEEGAGQRITASYKGKKIQYTLGLSGVHQAINSLGVLLAVEAAGVPFDAAFKALENLKPLDGRGAIHAIPHPAGGSFTLIDDSYNASVVSMKAALAELVRKKQQSKEARALVVLGDMRELGDHAEAFHIELADYVAALPIDKVFTAGTWMAKLYDRLPHTMRAVHAENPLSLHSFVLSEVKPGDLLLLKGSHGSDVWQLAHALTQPKDSDNRAVSSSRSTLG